MVFCLLARLQKAKRTRRIAILKIVLLPNPRKKAGYRRRIQKRAFFGPSCAVRESCIPFTERPNSQAKASPLYLLISGLKVEFHGTTSSALTEQENVYRVMNIRVEVVHNPFHLHIT
jgi:hypothetical protein